MTGISVPVETLSRLRSARGTEAQARVGVDIAREALQASRDLPGVKGAYIMPPFNRADRAASVIEGLI